MKKSGSKPVNMDWTLAVFFTVALFVQLWPQQQYRSEVILSVKNITPAYSMTAASNQTVSPFNLTLVSHSYYTTFAVLQRQSTKGTIYQPEYLSNAGVHAYNGNVSDHCVVCERRLYTRHNKIQCEVCNDMFHLACVGMNKTLYNLHRNNIKVNFTCSNCVFCIDDELFEQYKSEIPVSPTRTNNQHNNHIDSTDQDPCPIPTFKLPNKGIRMVSWNICHILNKLDQVKCILTQNPRPTDILGLSK